MNDQVNGWLNVVNGIPSLFYLIIFDRKARMSFNVTIKSKYLIKDNILVKPSFFISELVRLFKHSLLHYNANEKIVLFNNGKRLNPNERIFNCSITNGSILNAVKYKHGSTGYTSEVEYQYGLTDIMILNLSTPRKIHDIVKKNNRRCVKLDITNLPALRKSFWKILLKTRNFDETQLDVICSTYRRCFVEYGKYYYFHSLCCFGWFNDRLVMEENDNEIGTNLLFFYNN